MSDTSWSGTLALVLLWAIGPLIYLGIYVAGLLKPKVTKAAADDSASLDEQEESSPTEVETDAGETGEEEDTWTSMQYLSSLVGYAIGLGNVWRFSYVIARDGGSAALFAYVVCTVLVGTPLFMYEMILGQYLRKRAYEAWKFIKPRWKGLALSQFVMLVLVQSYYVMIIGYTVPYMIGSCVEPLPWTSNPAGSEGHWYEVVLGLKEVTGGSDGAAAELVDVENMEIQWTLVGSLLFTWIVIFFSVSFGKKIIADVTYVTVLAPVVLMVVLIIRTATLPGAMDGIRYYIGKFEAKELGNFNMWATALSQCLFSLSPGFGTAITLSAATDRREDVHRAAIITSTANTLYAIASGFAIFAMVGNIAHDSGRSVEDVASTGGQGLAFIVVADAMPTFGGVANVMSVMFFFMLFTLGLDSAFCWQETMNGTVEDLLEKYGGFGGDKRLSRWAVSLGTCIFCFLIGLPYATTKGNLILDGVDFYVGTNFLLLVCFVESIVLNFDFGWKRLEYALQKATLGKKTLVPIYQCCRFDFHVAIPIATLGLFLYQTSQVIIEPYMPGHLSIEITSWTLFGVCVALLLWGIWRRDDGKLEQLLVPFEEYPWGKEYWASAPTEEDKEDGAGKTGKEEEEEVQC